MGFMAVEGRSTGAPPEACALIQPQHPSSPQTSPVPFSVDLSAFTGNTSTSYTPGQTYISKECNTLCLFGILLLLQSHFVVVLPTLTSLGL